MFNEYWIKNINAITEDEPTRHTLYDFLNYILCAYNEKIGALRYRPSYEYDTEASFFDIALADLQKDGYDFNDTSLNFRADWEIAVKIFCDDRGICEAEAVCNFEKAQFMELAEVSERTEKRRAVL
jgi:hypothetical protein